MPPSSGALSSHPPRASSSTFAVGTATFSNRLSRDAARSSSDSTCTGLLSCANGCRTS